MTTLTQLAAGAAIILPENGLAEKLQLGRPLVIKLGFDPTAPDLHLGHAVVLRKLRQFQDLGHRIVIIVGSFTAQIGDPTGKNKSRRPLSKSEVMTNAETYLQQLGVIMDIHKCEIRFNDEWLSTLSFTDVITLLSKVTVSQLMQRHDFSNRFSNNMPIAMHELMYPILQGFDSLQIDADIEMGGTDQLFNCAMGRQLQEAHGKAPQVVMCMPLLRGLDGQHKMSKSLHNIIGLTDTPDEMFGKTMSMPDELLPEFIHLATAFSVEERAVLLDEKQHPMEVKKKVAQHLVSLYHDAQSAQAAADFFTNQFQRKAVTFTPISRRALFGEAVEATLLDVCHQLKPDTSKSQLRRLIAGGGVYIDAQQITDAQTVIRLSGGVKIKMGKLTFIELTE